MRTSIAFNIVAPVFDADGVPIVNNSILAELPLPTSETFPLSLAAPEPSTWAMMLIGFAGLGYAAVRRKGRRSHPLCMSEGGLACQTGAPDGPVSDRGTRPLA